MFEIKLNNNHKYNLTVGQPDNICYGAIGQSLECFDHEKNNSINFEYAILGM